MSRRDGRRPVDAIVVLGDLVAGDRMSEATAGTEFGYVLAEAAQLPFILARGLVS